LKAAKPRNTPMEPNTKYVSSPDISSTKETLKTKYRKLIGSLLYISQNIRSDIIYVNYLSRFQNNPTENHYAGVKRIIRYFRNLGLLLFGKNMSDELWIR